jgi:hypothetical protein
MQLHPDHQRIAGGLQMIAEHAIQGGQRRGLPRVGRRRFAGQRAHALQGRIDAAAQQAVDSANRAVHGRGQATGPRRATAERQAQRGDGGVHRLDRVGGGAHRVEGQQAAAVQRAHATSQGAGLDRRHRRRSEDDDPPCAGRSAIVKAAGPIGLRTPVAAPSASA